MRKAWVFGGAAVVAAAGIATAVAVGAVKGKPATGPGGAGTKAEVALEFTAREVVRPMVAPLPVHVEFSGPLVAPSTAVVRAKAHGTLLALSVAEGSRVRAGQVLGTLDLGELQGRVAERNALLESARAQLAQAERTHESNQRLAAQQFISSHALETSRSALETARAQARAAEAQLATMRVSLRDAALVAKSRELAELRAQRQDLEMRAQLMRDTSLSRDLLEERARSLLGFADPRDYVIRMKP